MRPTSRGSPPRRSPPAGPPWNCGRPPATRSGSGRGYGGCRGCTGGTVGRKEAEAAAARAIAVLETLPPGHQLAMAYSNQGQLDILAYRAETAIGWARRAIELARRLDDQETLTHALTSIGSARLYRGDPGGRADLERGFEVAAAAGLEDHAARALINLATTTAEVLDYRHARQDLDRALAFVQAHELAGYAQHLLGYRARVRLDQGDWAGAEQDAQAALDEPVEGGAGVVDALVPLGLLQARRGDPDATATLQEAAERAFATELQWIAPVAAARAEHAWLAGDDHRVAEEAASVLELAVQAAHPRFAGELALWLRLAGAPVPEPAVMAEQYRLLLAGDWRAAADAWQALGCPYQQALALACGDQDEAPAGGLGAAGRPGRPADGPAAPPPAPNGQSWEAGRLSETSSCLASTRLPCLIAFDLQFRHAAWDSNPNCQIRRLLAATSRPGRAHAGGSRDHQPGPPPGRQAGSKRKATPADLHPGGLTSASVVAAKPAGSAGQLLACGRPPA